MADAAAHDSTGHGDLSPGTVTPAMKLLPLIAPAILVGIGSSLVLLGISKVAARLENLLWHTVPRGLDIDGFGPWWIITVLTATGIAVGLTVWKSPGHAGPDPATVGLVDPPQPLPVLPGLILATVLALGGGVSLGPEN